MRDRSCLWVKTDALQGNNKGEMGRRERSGGSYEEKCICKECVEEDCPADPAGCPLSSAQDLGDCQSDDDSDEFVTRICDEIEQL